MMVASTRERAREHHEIFSRMLASTRNQPGLCLRIMGQEPRPRHRGEGSSDLELGVILAACALPCIGPAMVEHIFALAMGFKIGGQRAGQPAVFAIDQKGGGLPAGPRPNTGRCFERRKKGVADKGVGGASAGHVEGRDRLCGLPCNKKWNIRRAKPVSCSVCMKGKKGSQTD